MAFPPRTLGVTAARGGSKGIPRKNIKLLAGKPLIAHTITAALAAASLTRYLVSTDDTEIAAVARQWGAEVPFRRPAHLATDEAAQLDVLIHAVTWAEQQEQNRYDYVVVLQPTAPLRTTQDIENGLALLRDSGADAVVSIIPVVHGHPNFDMHRLANNRMVPLHPDVEAGLRRQDCPPVYVRNGAIYAVRRDVLVGRRSLYGADCRPYIMPPERSANIDSPLDLDFAEFLFNRAA